MGKATIVSEIGEGSYMISVNYDIDRSTSKIVSLTELIDDLEETLPDLEDLRDDEVTTLDGLIVKQDNTINSLNAATDPEIIDAFKQLIQFNTVLINKSLATIKAIDRILINKKSEITSATKERELMQDTVDDYNNKPNVQEWCATYSLGLTGEVGTIELNDETNAPNNQAIIIAPEGNADTKRIQPIESSGAAAILYNLASYPGFQKWKPRYRSGTISDINTTTSRCTVAFNEKISSVVGYDGTRYIILDAGTVFNDSPIIYNTGGSAVFVSGDAVVAEFTVPSQGVPSQAVVRGFVSNPKGPTGIRWWDFRSEIELFFQAETHVSTRYTYSALVHPNSPLISSPGSYHLYAGPHITSYKGGLKWNNFPAGVTATEFKINTGITKDGYYLMEIKTAFSELPSAFHPSQTDLKMRVVAITSFEELDAVCVNWNSQAGPPYLLKIYNGTTNAFFSNDNVQTGNSDQGDIGLGLTTITKANNTGSCETLPVNP